MASFIDANLILRYLLNDPEAESIEKLFQKQEELILSSLVIAEVIWTLTSFYRWKKPKIIPPLLSLIKLPFIKIFYGNWISWSVEVILWSWNWF